MKSEPEEMNMKI